MMLFASGPTGIDILREASALGAIYDSSPRSYSPRCFPGTREQYIGDIVRRATPSLGDAPPPIYWLSGPTGVGKSAIAQTCAELLKDEGALGATFFFSIHEQTKPGKFFPSIAYQLTTRHAAYRDLIDRKIRSDNTIVGKSMRYQFQDLIDQPLRELEKEGQGIRKGVQVFIDGLDECEGADTQREIIRIIAGAASEGAIPLRWVFFSRPEPHITAIFSEPDIARHCYRTVISLSGSVDQEIEMYLRSGFNNIFQRDHVPPRTLWPSAEEMVVLVHDAGGSFIYATTVLRFIGYPDSLTPQKRLTAIIDAILDRRSHTAADTDRPFAGLDALYMFILQHILDNTSIPLLLALVCRFRSVSAVLAANILYLPQDTFEDICRRASAVIYLETPGKDLELGPTTNISHPGAQTNQAIGQELHRQVLLSLGGRVTLYHVSFLDFLKDPARSGGLYVTLKKALADHLAETQIKYDQSFHWLGSDLVPAFNVPVPLLSYPHTDELVNSSLKTWVYTLAGNEDSVGFPSSLSIREPLRDYRKHLHTSTKFTDIGFVLDGQLWGYQCQTKHFRGVRIDYIPHKGFSTFSIAEFKSMIEQRERAGIIQRYSPTLTSWIGSSFRDRSKEGVEAALYCVGREDKRIFWYWEISQKPHYYRSFRAISLVEGRKRFWEEDFNLWSEPGDSIGKNDGSRTSLLLADSVAPEPVALKSDKSLQLSDGGIPPEGSVEALGNHVPFTLDSQPMARYVATMSEEQQEAFEVEMAQIQTRILLQEARSIGQIGNTIKNVFGEVNYISLDLSTSGTSVLVEMQYINLDGRVERSKGTTLPVYASRFSNVFLGRYIDDSDTITRVAIKVLQMTEGANVMGETTRKASTPSEVDKLCTRTPVPVQRLIEEALVWQNLHHPNVLQYLGFSWDQGLFGCPALVTPYCDEGTVNDYLKLHPEIDGRLSITRGVSEGLWYLHKQGVIHGDLNPANIFIHEDGHPLLYLFNSSKILPLPKQPKLTSVHRYLAPESLDLNSEPAKAADVYAFALVSYEIWTGLRPFHDVEDRGISSHVLTRAKPDYPNPAPSGTEALWRIFEICWKWIPEERARMDEVVQALADTPFFTPATTMYDNDHRAPHLEGTLPKVINSGANLGGRAGGSTLKHAHDFFIHNPLVAGGIETGDPELSALEWLAARAMSGVEHNSSARNPPPRCYNGTRYDMIEQIRDLLFGPRPKKRFLWIFGPPGVGKSAIAQTLAETEARNARLGATVFFPPSPLAQLSQSPKIPSTTHGNDSRVWITISYRLSTNDPSYLAYVKEQIDHNPHLAERSMEQQFEALIAEPIGRRGMLRAPYPLLILIDGLDQCWGKGSESQERIVRLIVEFTQSYPDAPLVWIITSRPEQHLVRTFKKYQHLQDDITRLLITAESDDARKDVQYFLRSRFDDIRGDYDTIEPLPWPKENDFNIMLLAVSGLFSLASAITDFVGDRSVADPMGQFEIVLSVITHESPTTILYENPLADVHRIYTQILQSMPPDHYHTAKRILGFLLLPRGFGHWTSDSTSFWELCNILDIEKLVGYACLSRLHSLLEIPVIEDATTLPIRFFHDSVSRFLSNREYAGDFWIDPTEIVADLWHCHFRVLQEMQVSLVPRLTGIHLGWFSTADRVKDFRIKFWENARRVFLHHIPPCPSHPCISGIHYEDLSDDKNSTELIKILHKINFHNLVDGYGTPEAPHQLLTFLNWIVRGGNSLLWDHNLLRYLYVFGQDYGWIDGTATSFKFEDERQDDGGHLVRFRAFAGQVSAQSIDQVDPNLLFSTRDKAGSLSELIEDLTSHKFPAAIILGPPDSKCCGILADTSLQDHAFYYVLPYRPSRH